MDFIHFVIPQSIVSKTKLERLRLTSREVRTPVDRSNWPRTDFFLRALDLAFLPVAGEEAWFIECCNLWVWVAQGTSNKHQKMCLMICSLRCLLQWASAVASDWFLPSVESFSFSFFLLSLRLSLFRFINYARKVSEDEGWKDIVGRILRWVFKGATARRTGACKVPSPPSLYVPSLIQWGAQLYLDRDREPRRLSDDVLVGRIFTVQRPFDRWAVESPLFALSNLKSLPLSMSTQDDGNSLPR